MVKNIDVNFDIQVGARSALCYIGKEGNSTADSDIVFQNISLSGVSSGTNTGVRIGQSYITPSTLWTKTIFDNISVKKMICSASSYAVIRSGFRNALVVENYVGGNFYAFYDSIVNKYPIIFRNCTIGDIAGSSTKDVFLVFENSHINSSGAANTYIQPFNKQFINTRIGASGPINKRHHDIYSEINQVSYALSSPAYVKTNLVGGVSKEWDNTDSARDLDLVAEPSATKSTSVTSRSIDHASFTSVTDYALENTKRFTLYVRNTSRSIAAVYTGLIVLYGDALTSFSACTVKLVVTGVTNINGSSYLAGDLTVTAPNADTLRFSMSRPSEMMSVLIYDN